MTTSNASPFVSVVIACFNTAPWLAATLRSVQAQTFQEFELILVDDGSSDATLSIMQSFASKDARMRVIPLRENKGVVAARNTALRQATGEYIAMLDGDDLWVPDALAIRVALAKRFQLADVIATEFSCFKDEPIQREGRVGLGTRARQAFARSFATGEPTLLLAPFDLVATLCFAWIGATLVRRSSMASIGWFDPNFVGTEDTLLWLRLAQRGAFVFAPQITALYRQRTGSLSTSYGGPKELQYLTVLKWIRGKPEFASHRSVIDRVMADCHNVCAHYYRKLGARSTARNHALSCIKYQPFGTTYWHGLVGACLDSLSHGPQRRER